MVATEHPLATEAGVMALRQGGNAVDAAIAAGLTLGVLHGFNSGIGGGCFVLIRTADGEIIAIDGREIAPAAAHRDMYLVNGKPDTTLSHIGPFAIGVPGALKAYERAVREHGKTKFSDLIADAARIAADGFDSKIVERLKKLGHDTVNSRSVGITQAIIFDPQKKVFMGVHDPRTPGAAKGQ